MDRRREEYREHRREERNKSFCQSREIPTEKEDFKDDRKAKLLKWKSDRALQKKLAAKNKKPVFLVGVYHHKYFSPGLNGETKCNCQRRKEEKSSFLAGVETINKEPAAGKISVNETDTQKKKRSHFVLEARARKRAAGSEKNSENESQKRKSFAPEKFKFQAPEGINPIPLVATSSDHLRFDLKFDEKSIKKYDAGVEKLSKSTSQENRFHLNETYVLENVDYSSSSFKLLENFFCHSSLLDNQETERVSGAEIQREGEEEFEQNPIILLSSPEIVKIPDIDIHQREGQIINSSTCGNEEKKEGNCAIQLDPAFTSSTPLPKKIKQAEIEDGLSTDNDDYMRILILRSRSVTISPRVKKKTPIRGKPEITIEDTTSSMGSSNSLNKLRLSFLGEPSTKTVEPFSNGDLILFESPKQEK